MANRLGETETLTHIHWRVKVFIMSCTYKDGLDANNNAAKNFFYSLNMLFFIQVVFFNWLFGM